MSTIRVDNFGPSGGGTAYSARGIAKSWVNANGVGVVSVRDSLNVSSMTDEAAGTYSFAYTSAMGSSDYAGFVMGSNEPSGGTLGMPQWQGPIAAGAKVREVYNGVGGCSCYFPSPDNYAIRADREVVSYGIFGDLA